MSAVIEIKNVKKTYHMGDIEVNALSDVSLQVEQGEMVAITKVRKGVYVKALEELAIGDRHDRQRPEGVLEGQGLRRPGPQVEAARAAGGRSPGRGSRGSRVGGPGRAAAGRQAGRGQHR